MISLIHLKESAQFLQRITTQDVTACDVATLCLICNHQGKVLSRFWLKSDHKDCWLYIETISVNHLAELIKKYDIHETLELSVTHSHSPLDFGIETQDTPWALYLIQNELIQITPEIMGKHTPNMLGLIEKGAVSFSKGCFIGHEPIARTNFKGRVKRKLKYTQSNTAIEALNSFYHNGIHHNLILEAVN